MTALTTAWQRCPYRLHRCRIRHALARTGHCLVVRLSAAAVCRGLLGRSPCASGALGHRQPLDLRAFAGRVLHRLDVFRQRGAGCLGRGVVFAHLPGAHAGHGAGLDRAAQDDPHCQGLPHHVDCRLCCQPLRQEPAAGRAGDPDRGGGHRALHRAAAQGGVGGLCPADGARRRGRPRTLEPRQCLLCGAGAGRLCHGVWCAAPGHHRAARGHGGRHRV